MSDPLLGVAFALAAAISLGASWLLVAALERVGARLGLSEALLGMLAALAADAPEITAAVTALVRHDQRVGAGVVIGSNVFNLAALIGLSAVIAGADRVAPPRDRAGGAVALWIVGRVACRCHRLCFSPLVGLALGAGRAGAVRRAPRHAPRATVAPATTARWTSWLVAAISEEELELEPAIHPRRGHARDALTAVGTVGGGRGRERRDGADRLGAGYRITRCRRSSSARSCSLACTSLPNAVAAVYLARRGRGRSRAQHLAQQQRVQHRSPGCLIPTTFIGLGAPSGQTTFVAAAYLAMTVLALSCAYVNRGLRRNAGLVIIAAYLAFTGVLLASAY